MRSGRGREENERYIGRERGIAKYEQRERRERGKENTYMRETVGRKGGKPKLIWGGGKKGKGEEMKHT